MTRWFFPRNSPLAILNTIEYAMLPAAPETRTRLGSSLSEGEAIERDASGTILRAHLLKLEIILVS